MKQLSGLDAAFLYLETAQMPMHVGALQVFELPAGYRGRFVTALRKHVAGRLPLAPVLNRRLRPMPLNLANPAWVEAAPDLEAHIVEQRLPRSAARGDGMNALLAAVGRLHSSLLDRSKPLWKFHLFVGLGPTADGRRRVALYSQLHHAAVDGQAAVALAGALLDLKPEARPVTARPHALQHPGAASLETAEVLRGVIGNQAQKVAQLVRGLPATLGTLGGAARQWLGRSSAPGAGRSAASLTLAPRTPFNVTVDAGRIFSCISLPLAEVKAFGEAHGATLNDMVLWLCSGALRRFLGQRQALPRKSLVAAVPFSLRQRGDASADNQVSMSLVDLGTNVADPLRRLEHVKAAAAAMKTTMGSLKSVLPTDFPSLGVPWLLEAASTLYGKARLAERLPLLANLVISNVPGPPLPMYMAGARLLNSYPVSIVAHGLGLNITVQSYDRWLEFGLTADARAVPDVAELATALGDALAALQALSSSEAAAAAGAASRSRAVPALERGAPKHSRPAPRRA